MLTVGEFRKHVSTPLDDDAVQRLLDAAEEDIRTYTHSEVISPVGDWLPLSHEAETVIAAHEAGEVLPVTSYKVVGNILVRLNEGTRPRRRWYGPIEVEYTARSNEATREMVQLSLVKFDLNYEPGVEQTTIGSFNEMFVTDPARERRRILSRLNESTLVWPV
jgi:hypothetical protein